MRIVFIIGIALLLGTACSSSDSKKEVNNDKAIETAPGAENITNVHLDVKGMTCEGCENAVVANINKLEGVQEASASHTNEEAVIAFDASKLSVDDISKAIADAGYSVEGEKAEPHN